MPSRHPPGTSCNIKVTWEHGLSFSKNFPPVSLIHNRLVINAKSFCHFKYFPIEIRSKPAKSARFESHGGCQMRCIASILQFVLQSTFLMIHLLRKNSAFPRYPNSLKSIWQSSMFHPAVFLHFTTLPTPSSTCQCSTLTQSSQQYMSCGFNRYLQVWVYGQAGSRTETRIFRGLGFFRWVRGPCQRTQDPRIDEGGWCTLHRSWRWTVHKRSKQSKLWGNCTLMDFSPRERSSIGLCGGYI
jgi:hypothetical protein